MSRRSKPGNDQAYFDRVAEEYRLWLEEHHPEHFIKTPAQATQRQTTLVSLDLLAAECRDVHVYSELLVMWRDEAGDDLAKLVPDVMVVVSPTKPVVDTNYTLAVQPARPFWVMEYVSGKRRSRKDYQKTFEKCERSLRTPYYLVFNLKTRELRLFHLSRGAERYAAVPPNSRGRYPIVPLDVEVAIHNGWLRYWWRGELLLLPVEMLREQQAIQREIVALRAELGRLNRVPG